MPVCSIVQTITPRCRGRPDALLHAGLAGFASPPNIEKLPTPMIERHALHNQMWYQ